jgi:hypothetical protein
MMATTKGLACSSAILRKPLSVNLSVTAKRPLIDTKLNDYGLTYWWPDKNYNLSSMANPPTGAFAAAALGLEFSVCFLTVEKVNDKVAIATIVKSANTSDLVFI